LINAELLEALLLQPRDRESIVIAIKWLEELVMQPSYGF